MPRNTELSRLRGKKRFPEDACVAVGSWIHKESNGAWTESVPAGATGLLIQQEGSGNTWFCLRAPVTATNQGFIVPTGAQITRFWFDPNQTTTLYGFNDANSDCHIQWIKSANYPS